MKLDRTLRAFAPIAVLAALLSLAAFGIAGVGRDGFINFDGRVLYAAGVTWLHHDNPYDHDQLSRDVAGESDMDMESLGFFYPPQSAALCLVQALFPYPGARIVWLLMNLAALAAIVAMTAESLRRRGSSGSIDRYAPLIVAAVLIGNPFTTHVVWMGQTSMVAYAAILGTWFFATRHRPLLAGLCFGLATFKPQLAILLGVWLLLDRNWKTLLAGAGSALLLALYPILTRGGPVAALLDWRTGVSSDYAMPFNLPSFSHKVGLQSLVFAMSSLTVPGAAIMLASIVLTVLLWIYRNRLVQDDLLSLLMIITLTFSVYLHDYDYVALFGAFASLWWVARRGRAYAVMSMLCLLAMFVPQRLLRGFGIAVLDQWRSIIVALIGFLILYSSATARRGLGSAISANPKPVGTPGNL